MFLILPILTSCSSGNHSNNFSTENVIGSLEAGQRAIIVHDWRKLSVLPTPKNILVEDIKTSGQFIRVNITATNTSQQIGNLKYSTFTLQDSQGRTFRNLERYTVKGGNFLAYETEFNLGKRRENMFPGESVQDAIVFDVPKDSSNFIFEWKGQKINLK